jgi:hypothetical protein
MASADEILDRYKQANAILDKYAAPPLPPATQQIAEDAAQYAPMVLGAGGGLAGSALGLGLGSIPLAGAGGALGEGIKKAVEAHYGKNQQTPSEMAQDIATEGAKQGAYELGAKGIELGARAAAPYVKPYIDPVISALKEKLITPVQDYAATKALKAFNPSKADYKMFGAQLPNQVELGREALDSGIIGTLPVGPSTLSKRASEKVAESGANLEEIKNRLSGLESRGDISGVPEQDIINGLKQRLLTPNAEIPEVVKANQGMMDRINSFQGRNELTPNLSFDRVRKLKAEIKPLTNFTKEASPEQTYANGLYRTLADAEDKLAADIESGVTGKETGDFSTEKQAYGRRKVLERLAEGKAASEEASRKMPIGLGDLAVGAGMGTIAPVFGKQSEAVGIASTLASKYGRKYGNQAMARALYSSANAPKFLSELVSKYPELLTQPAVRNIPIPQPSPWQGMKK